MTKRSTLAAAALAAALTFGLPAAPALSGEAELALLSSYIGSWRGEGVLKGSDNEEPFRCRLSVAKGNQAKINYSGRCSLVNVNLSVAGTIAFDDSAKRYFAAMSSNAGFTGQAVGRKSGDKITFDLAEKQQDEGGNDVRIGSKISLIGDTITVEFEVEFNQSGHVMTALVPFSR